MGDYFLYGTHDNRPVYQHRSGLEYLFHAHSQAWAIGAAVGGLRVGIINFRQRSDISIVRVRNNFELLNII